MSATQKIDEKSAPACSSALEVFSTYPTNSSIQKSGYREIIPQNTITREGPYEFQAYSDNKWFDLSFVYIQLILSLEKKSGHNWVPIATYNAGDASKTPVVPASGDKNIGVIQSIGQSFFQVVKILVQNVELATHNHYPYLCYIKNMLSFTEEARQTLLSPSGYWSDGIHEDVDNYGLKKRIELFAGGRVCEFYSKLEFDLSNQERFLLNNMHILFQLHRADDQFLLHTPDNTDETKYRIKIHDMRMFIKTVDVQPSVNVGVLAMLNNSAAKYCLRKTDVRTLFLTAGRTEVAHNLYSSIRPRRIILGMVDNTAYTGTVTKTPFNFQKFDLRSVSIEVGANVYPATRYDFNFGTSQPSFMRAFTDFHQSLNITRGYADTCGIGLGKWLKGWFLISIPLTPLLDDSNAFELIEQGTTVLKMQFSKPIPTGGVTVITLAEFDQLVSIDQNRVIITDGAPS